MMSVPFNKSIRRNIVWAYLRVAAARKGIKSNSLRRVADYLDDKFGIRKLESDIPSQRPSSFLPGLEQVPVYEPDTFAWTRLLEERSDDIRREFFALRESGLLKPHPQNLADTGQWNTYYFFSNGHTYEEHCEVCPVTASVLSQIDGVGLAGQAYFSVMSAGTHVAAHCGPTNTRIRCHLGLIVPDSSVIRVDQTMLHWRELGCIVFDDSFEHEVWNPKAERAVLIVDLWHPGLTEEERWALQEITRFSRSNRKYRRSILTRR